MKETPLVRMLEQSMACDDGIKDESVRREAAASESELGGCDDGMMDAFMCMCVFVGGVVRGVEGK